MLEMLRPKVKLLDEACHCELMCVCVCVDMQYRLRLVIRQLM